jgi:NADH-quinone oxidoreductase subunit G
VEEAYLLAEYLRSIDPQALLAVGPVPCVGADETFPGSFTIHAEKCPNRRGVEAIVAGLGREFVDWDAFLERIESAPPGAVWVTGGYPAEWHDDPAAQRLADVGLLVVQDCFESPLWQRAAFQLPGGVFAEREGSYVNHADRLQSFDWAIRPPAGVSVEGALYWRLLQRRGLYCSQEVLREVATRLVYFSAAAEGVPPSGIDLKVNQLAVV